MSASDYIIDISNNIKMKEVIMENKILTQHKNQITIVTIFPFLTYSVSKFNINLF
jgi:hypothetical protein